MRFFGYFLFFFTFEGVFSSIQDYYCGYKNCYKLLNVSKYHSSINPFSNAFIYKEMLLNKMSRNPSEPYQRFIIPIKAEQKA